MVRVWGGDWDKGGDRKGYGKGASAWPRACFQCGSLDHLMKDCPSVKVQAVEGSEEPEVQFIGQVDNWVTVPRSNRDPIVAHCVKDWDHVEPPPGLLTNRFKVFEVDEDDEEQVDGQEVCHIRNVASKSGEKDNEKKCQTDDEWLNLGIGEIVVDLTRPRTSLAGRMAWVTPSRPGRASGTSC